MNINWNLVGIPALVALVVSGLRLAGELHGGPEGLFGTDAGGGGSLIGIAWLVPLFGIYFGMRLAKEGRGPASLGQAALMSLAAIVVAIVIGLASALVVNPEGIGGLFVMALISTPLAILLARKGWPAITQTLLGYGLLSRLPVVIIMLFALRGTWGTHYDALPPELDLGGWFQNWIVFGVVPQLTIWIAFTVVVGGLFGVLGALIGGKKAAA